jgi:hypothetical protein
MLFANEMGATLARTVPADPSPHTVVPPLDERTAVEDRAQAMVDWIDAMASVLCTMQVRAPTRQNVEILWALKLSRDAIVADGVNVQ